MAIESLQQLKDKISRKQNKNTSNHYIDNQNSLSEELSRVPEYALDAAMNLPSNLWEIAKQVPEASIKSALHPQDAFRDVLGGLARGSQNLGASGLEAGEYLTRKGAEGIGKLLGNNINVPKWDAREFAGLGEKNPVDLGAMIESKNPNKLLSGIGQFGLGGASGGARLLPMMASNAAYGATQAKPGDRIKAATENAIGVGLPSMAVKGAGALTSGGNSLVKYLQPGKAGEEFRAGFGQGTSRENAAELGKLAGKTKSAAKEEALIPKREFYSQHGKENIYEMGKEKLPEGNLEKIAEMADPGTKFTIKKELQLENALKEFRKSDDPVRDIEIFKDKLEEIFNLDELPEKAASQIEDALLMPTKKNSRYFSNKNVTDYYNDAVQKLHDRFERKPTAQRYDKLQSSIKSEIRKLEGLDKNLDTAGQQKLTFLKKNLDNLEKDFNSYNSTLPSNMQTLVKDFSNKYRNYAETYKKGSSETGPSLTLRRLAGGRADKVSDANIVQMFSKPTQADKNAILAMGEPAAKRVIYAALQKVPIGEAGKIAETILDLKRTKGFDNIVTPEMEQWAHNMIKHERNANLMKDVLKGAAGGTVGSFIAGPYGAATGAAIGAGYRSAKNLIQKVKK